MFSKVTDRLPPLTEELTGFDFGGQKVRWQ